MGVYEVPYGKGWLTFELPEDVQVEVVRPAAVPGVTDPRACVEAALDAPLGEVSWAALAGARSAAIAINDETRPVPHEYLLPPLLARLEALGLAPDAIRLLIASGAHRPMPRDRYVQVVPPEILARYPVTCHDADSGDDLVRLGATSRGTPILVNRHFLAAEVRIVVGVVEPHQFQGFSGGVKSAAIGLAGRETIDRNHALMADPRARLGRYADNPTRQDVEEIGEIIGVHLALNVVLNSQKEIVHALAGRPRAVMDAAVPASLQVSQVAVAAPFDLVIASPGGHPKDLNFYQSQKALLHAGLVARDGGAVVLVAACPDGIGSLGYEAWMEGKGSHKEVIASFERGPFRVGPHKAYLVSRDAVRVRTILVSEMDPARVRHLLLERAGSIDAALGLLLPHLPDGARIGILPMASSTIPSLDVGG
ncbi:MAG: nickel-dependent lactate racemase [Anaerolineae bacterium]|nr:nickel-dependent lactate racemase [Anaerolineae bacterium]